MSVSGRPPLMKWVNYAWRQLTHWLKHHTDQLTQRRCSETMGAVNTFSQGRAAVINLHSLAWDKKLINWKTACWREWAGQLKWHSMGDMHVLAKTHPNLVTHFNHKCLPLVIQKFHSLNFETTVKNTVAFFLVYKSKKGAIGSGPGLNRKGAVVPFCPCRLLNLSPISGLRVCLSKILIRKASSALDEIITFSM